MITDMRIDKNSKSKKVLLLGASFTSRNMGVWALASGALNSVLHIFPDAEVFLLDYHKEQVSYQVRLPTGTALTKLINLRFSKKFWLPNNIARLLLTALLIRMFPSRLLRNRLITQNYWLRSVKMADIIGSIAGGDSFSDIYGIKRLIYVALPQFLVLLLGKPLVLLPQTIGPFKGIFARAIGRFILMRAQMIYSRDTESLTAVRELLKVDDRRLALSYDMGFVLEPHIRSGRIPTSLAMIDPTIPILGLNVSGLLYIGGYTQDNMFELMVDYRQLIRKLIEYFVHKHSAHVILVPHVFGGDHNKESDMTACYRIYRELVPNLRKYLHLVGEEYNQHEIKALIGRCEFFIGSRMHACIAALSQCVPAIGLAYSRKFRGVFATIGMEELVLDLRKINCHLIIEGVDRIYGRREVIRSLLEAKIPAVKESVLNLFTIYSNETSQ